MPAKGSHLKYGNRSYIMDREFYKKVQEQHNLPWSYVEANRIINEHLKKVAKAIVEEIDGIKLPGGTGYIFRARYKPKKPYIDFKETKRCGYAVYHMNAETGGYACEIIWNGASTLSQKTTMPYRFEGCRKLTRAVSAHFRTGALFNIFSKKELYQKNKTERMINKLK